MTLRYIAIDPAGNVYEITAMFNSDGKRTTDPRFASAIVVERDHYTAHLDADDVPIYTVH